VWLFLRSGLRDIQGRHQQKHENKQQFLHVAPPF
jgi:hypothetical protein